MVIAIVPKKKNPKIINAPFIRSLNIEPKLIRHYNIFNNLSFTTDNKLL